MANTELDFETIYNNLPVLQAGFEYYTLSQLVVNLEERTDYKSFFIAEGPSTAKYIRPSHLSTDYRRCEIDYNGIAKAPVRPDIHFVVAKGEFASFVDGQMKVGRISLKDWGEYREDVRAEFKIFPVDKAVYHFTTRRNGVVISDYVLKELMSEYVIDQARKICAITGLNYLRSSEYQYLKISVPSLERQDEILSSSKRAKPRFADVVWKYCSARRGYSSLSDALNEIALFLFSERGIDTGNLVQMVRYAFGEKCRYQDDILSKEEELSLLDHYPEVIEMVINPPFDGAIYRAEYLQPEEITRYAASFFNPQKEYQQPLMGEEPYRVSKFYNPFSGLASYEIALPEYHFFGEELNSETWALSQIRLHAHGISSSIINKDFFSDGKKEQYKGIITTSPFGMPGDRSIEKVIAKLYDMLEEKGQLVMVVTPGFLFGSGRSTFETRKRLLEDKAVTDVILLPEGLFPRTSIQVALLVVEKCPHSSVHFVDASSAYRTVGKNRVFDESLLNDLIRAQEDDSPVAMRIGFEDLLKNGCNLNPAYLIAKASLETENRLTSIAHTLPLTRVQEEVQNALFFSPAELHPYFARTPIDVHKLERRTIKPGRYYLVNSPVVIFDYKSHSEQVRVAFLEQAPAEPFYVSEFTVALQPNETVSPLYLMLVLSDNHVKKQLAAIASVATMRKLNLSLVSDIFIPVHSLEEQDNMIMEAMRTSMSLTERELDAAFAKYKKNVRSRKHALSQNVSALSARWNAFNGYRKAHESITGADIISRKHALSVSEICDIITNFINTISAQTDAIADVTYNWGDVEWIGLPFYISQYVRTHRSTDYDLINAGADNTAVFEFMEQMKDLGAEEAVSRMLSGNSQEPPLENIKFPPKALRHILDNIIANAVAHGFVDKTREDYRVCLDWKEEDGNVVLYVFNNGEPLHPEMDPDSVLEFGSSTSLNENGHAGLGGYEVASIMEQFGGSVEVLSTPAEEYSVTYKLTFTQVSKYLPEDEID